MRYLWLVGLLFSITIIAGSAATITQALQPGDTLQVTCPSSLVATPVPISGQMATIVCIGLTPTPTRTMTPTPTATPSANVWHAPTTHEHGDQPPAWVETSGLAPQFYGSEHHNGFKGFLTTTQSGVQVYVLAHLFATPAARQARYHSYAIWIKDLAGNVSYYSGWMDTGDPALLEADGSQTTRRTRGATDTGSVARVINLPSEASYAQYGQSGCETWYTQQSAWLGAWLICEPPYFYYQNDLLRSQVIPSHYFGLVRGMDLNGSIYPWDPVGDYCTNGYWPNPIPCSTPGSFPQRVATTLVDSMPNGQLIHRVDPKWFPGWGQVTVPN